MRATSEEWEEWAVCNECRKWRVLPADHGARLDPEADFCCTDITGLSCRRSQQPYEVRYCVNCIDFCYGVVFFLVFVLLVSVVSL